MDTPSEHITVTFPDKQTASRIVDLIVRKKPHGWGRRSYATYYRPEYGEWLRKELQPILDTGEPQVFRLTGRYTMNSLYLLINQAFTYLREEVIDKDKWIELWEKVKVEKHKGVGVIISIKEPPKDLPTGENFVPKTETPKWRRELNDYLSGDEIRPFHKDRLVLTNEEVNQIKIELDGLENIQFSINNKEIKIIKTL